MCAAAVVVLCGCATTLPAPAPAPAPAPEEARPAPEGPAPAAPRPLALHPIAAAGAPVRTAARVTIGAVGDVLMHGAVKECAAAHRLPGTSPEAEEAGYLWLYAGVADLLAQPDLMFANLETPIAPSADKGSRSYVFNAPVAAVRALRRAGVDLVSVANNHLFDQGRDGFLETLERLDTAGMAYIGAGEEGAEGGLRRITVNGLTLAFLGWSSFFNDAGNDCPEPRARPCLRAGLLDGERAVAAVQKAAAGADAVVVSLHWGVEYAPQPRTEDVDLAHRLADAGALVILGHHPHVLQPIELYRRVDGRFALIAYSLGNFISNQSRNFVPGVTPERAAATRDGALLRIDIARQDYGRGVAQVELAATDYLPLWTENDTVDLDRRKDPRARPSIRVVSLDRALAGVRSELAALPEPLPAADRARYLKLRQREQLYLSRRAAVAAVLGEDLAAEAPPAPALPTASR